MYLSSGVGRAQPMPGHSMVTLRLLVSYPGHAQLSAACSIVSRSQTLQSGYARPVSRGQTLPESGHARLTRDYLQYGNAEATRGVWGLLPQLLSFLNRFWDSQIKFVDRGGRHWQTQTAYRFDVVSQVSPRPAPCSCN